MQLSDYCIKLGVKHREAFSTLKRVNEIGAHIVRLKARPGRGREREAWVGVLHQDLRKELDLLCNLGVKFNLSDLQLLVLDILKSSKCDEYRANMIDPFSDVRFHKGMSRGSKASQYNFVLSATPKQTNIEAV